MNTSPLWDKVKQLEGGKVSTKNGRKFHVYRVTDTYVYYDPEGTKHPGSHSSSRDVLLRLADRIRNSRRTPPSRVIDMGILCEELKITGYEQSYTYLYALLSAIGVIKSDTAGRLG